MRVSGIPAEFLLDSSGDRDALCWLALTVWGRGFVNSIIDASGTNNPTVWRSLPILNAPGPVQMAIDEWLLEQHRTAQHPPTLRFYTWSPAAISLGHHQRHYPDHWRSLQWQQHPIDIVRRPSGGRAVLHQGDLTYAIITSGLEGDRTAAYQHLCEFLIAGWRSLGVVLNYGRAERGYHHQTNCFGLATAADLVTENGVKWIGSAQLRRGSAILQHGSMRLRGDRALAQQVFAEEPADAAYPKLPNALSQLPDEALHRVISQALNQSAEQTFGVQLEERSLSMAEWQEIMHRAGLQT